MLVPFVRIRRICVSEKKSFHLKGDNSCAIIISLITFREIVCKQTSRTVRKFLIP